MCSLSFFVHISLSDIAHIEYTRKLIALVQNLQYTVTALLCWLMQVFLQFDYAIRDTSDTSDTPDEQKNTLLVHMI